MAKKQFKLQPGGKQAANINIQVTGYKELTKSLDAFSKSIKNSVIKKALKEMAKPIVRSVMDAAPKDVGLLKKSIKFKLIPKSKRTGNVSLRIGPQNKRTKVVKRAFQKTKKFTRTLKKKIIAGKALGKVVFANPSKYAHLVALGTKRTSSRANFFLSGLNRALPRASLEFRIAVEDGVKRAAIAAASAKELKNE